MRGVPVTDHLVWLGHDSFRISGSVIVYIDPWHIAAGAPAADVILVTHDHFDHFSSDDVARLSKEGTVVVGPSEVTTSLGAEGLTIAPGETVHVGDVTVTAVPAYNTDKYREPGVVFHPHKDGKVGFIVIVDGVSYYHAGDTDQIPEMDGIDVDVALVPVSGTYVMTAEEAAAACASFTAGVVVPMHFDTIVGSISDAERFKELCPLPVEILAPTSP
jgi:L-ascorbate metabolism protein UlaG (beta-lactamase superfamily)